VEEELRDKCDLLHDWLEEKKNDGGPMESSTNSICGTTFVFCKVGSTEHYVQSTFQSFKPCVATGTCLD
jgi:hypothetical protein